MPHDSVTDNLGRSENLDEEQARRWLEEGDHTVEKIRDDPPDFLVDGKYGVEVTRLHTQEDDHGGRCRKQALRRTMDDLFREISPPPWHPSYSVVVRYDMKKKLPNERTVTQEARKALGNLWRARLPCGVSLDLVPACPSTSKPRYSVSTVNSGEGKYPVREYLSRIPKAVAGKTEKLAAMTGKYDELWLVLVDHIGHAPMDPHEADEVKRRIPVEAPWNRIVILSSTQPPFATELLRLDESQIPAPES